MPEHGLKPEKVSNYVESACNLWYYVYETIVWTLFFLHPEYILKTFTLIPKTGRHYKKITNMNTDIEIETDHQPRLDAWDKCSGLVHWEDPEEWDGEGGGRGDWDGEHM